MSALTDLRELLGQPTAACAVLTGQSERTAVTPGPETTCAVMHRSIHVSIRPYHRKRAGAAPAPAAPARGPRCPNHTRLHGPALDCSRNGEHESEGLITPPR